MASFRPQRILLQVWIWREILGGSPRPLPIHRSNQHDGRLGLSGWRRHQHVPIIHDNWRASLAGRLYEWGWGLGVERWKKMELYQLVYRYGTVWGLILHEKNLQNQKCLKYVQECPVNCHKLKSKTEQLSPTPTNWLFAARFSNCSLTHSILKLKSILIPLKKIVWSGEQNPQD